jgi:parvulin-like peptidyl-prolyl isomerase
MTHEKLERYVADSAIVPKLRDRIAGGRVEEYFRQHPGDFDSARVARIELADENKAHELAGQIRSGAENFFAAAELVFFEAAGRGSPPKASLFALIERRQAEPALCDQLFAATPGQLVGPIPVESGYTLMRLVEIIPGQLDDRTRTVIKDILFKDWLAEQRKAARIEWCWGNASKTAA